MIELTTNKDCVYLTTKNFDDFKKLERYIKFTNEDFRWGPEYIKTPLTARNDEDWKIGNLYVVAVLDSELSIIKEAIKLLNDTTI